MVRDFYVFRHGESTYNTEGRIQGHTDDSVLTTLGEKQAKEIGEKLQNRGIEIIVTSPLKRAVQTAELANQILKLPIVIDKHFIEVNVGIVEGMPYSEVMDQYKETYDKLHSPNLEECFDVCYPNGETKREVQRRIWQGLNEWCQKPQQYKTIAVSSHGIVLVQILNKLNMRAGNIKNGAILHIQENNGQWKALEMI